MRKPLRQIATLLSFAMVISSCGGGGSASQGGSVGAPAAQTPNATPVQLVASPPLPSTVPPGAVATTQIFALDASGARTDVTNSVQLDATSTSLVNANISAGNLVLTFAQTEGQGQLRLNADGLSLSQPVTIKSLIGTGANDFRFFVEDVPYSPMVMEEGTNSYYTIPGRLLQFISQAQVAQQWLDVTNNTLVTSSDPSVISVTAETIVGTADIWFAGRVLKPGAVDITATYGSFSQSMHIVVSPAITVAGVWASAAGLTENSQGRVTSYFTNDATPLASKGNLHPVSLWFTESSSNGAWSSPTELPVPSYVTVAQGVYNFAESPNGHRVVAANGDVEGTAWAYLIDQAGTVTGPILLATDLGPTIEREVAHVHVRDDGSADIWLISTYGELRRLFLNAADLSVALVSSFPQASLAPHSQFQLHISEAGTVAAAWMASPCVVTYLFDSLLQPVPTTELTSSTVTIASCNSTYWSSFSMAAGTSAMGLAVRSFQDLMNSQVHLISLPSSGTATDTLLYSEPYTYYLGWLPRIASDASGGFVALWQASDPSVWAVYQAPGSTPGAPFLVQSSYFVLGTPDVDNVYPRGDGRFLLAYYGGNAGVDNPLLFKDYSPTTGLSERKSMPYEVVAASNLCYLSASIYGVSAIWSYPPDIGYELVSSVKAFTP